MIESLSHWPRVGLELLKRLNKEKNVYIQAAAEEIGVVRGNNPVSRCQGGEMYGTSLLQLADV